MDQEIQQHLANLRSLVTPRGLFLAAPHDAQTNYNKVWLRDNVYETLAFEAVGDWETVRKTYHALLDIFLKYADKIHHGAENKPSEYHQQICSRYDPETLDEVWEGGNKQYDALGAVLYKLADFEAQGKSMFRDDQDRQIVQAVISYLCTAEYWQDPDSGMWEEGEELRASSVGAVLAALNKWQAAGGMQIDQQAIENGETALHNLLPRETGSRFVDLALLSLIYPYEIVDDAMAAQILANVTYHLERANGVIRYVFDRYYNKNEDGYSEEAEWVFGLSWLAIIYQRRGDTDRARSYLEKTKAVVNPNGQVPELYMSHSNESNANAPLGWAESLHIVALKNIGEIPNA